MILAALLQVALAQPAVLAVQGPAGPRVLAPLVQTATGPAVAPQALMPALAVDLRSTVAGRYVLRIGTVPFEVVEQVPFVRVGDQVVPVVGAPFVGADGRLHVPLQLVTEIYPRYATGALYDADRGELFVGGAIARGTPPPPAGASRAAEISGAFAAGAGSVVATDPAGASAGSAAGARSTTDPGARPAPASPAVPPRPRKRVVVVDAGHGGRDGGTSGRARGGALLVEKDVALSVAHLVTKALRDRNVEVVMTRSTDVFVELPQRGRIANEHHGDLFISIHVNASGPQARNGSAARGVETYFLAVAKTEDAQRVADMENASVRFETQADVAKDDPLAFIINDMAENEHLRESSDLAAVIQKRLSARHPGPVGDRGVKQGPFRVLVTSYMPAVLVELGFATNPDDAAYLLDPANQRKMAEAIAAAAIQYFEDYERRIGTGSAHR